MKKKERRRRNHNIMSASATQGGHKQQCLPHMPHNMVNFGQLAAEIGPAVWGAPANFNGFRVFAELLHGTPVLGVIQTLQR